MIWCAQLTREWFHHRLLERLSAEVTTRIAWRHGTDWLVFSLKVRPIRAPSRVPSAVIDVWVNEHLGARIGTSGDDPLLVRYLEFTKALDAVLLRTDAYLRLRGAS